jgi:hypothetical protein
MYVRFSEEVEERFFVSSVRVGTVVPTLMFGSWCLKHDFIGVLFGERMHLEVCVSIRVINLNSVSFFFPSPSVFVFSLSFVLHR